jgi:uncharacterized protein (TIGR02246 family)
MNVDRIRKAIDEGNSAWIRAFRETDSGLFVSLFDEDGAILGRNGNIVQGREKIKEHISAAMKEMGSATVTVKTRDVWVIRELAYETGDYSYAFKPTGGSGVKTTGRYVTIWKQQADGSWKIYRDIGLPNE